jgi:hypothetical protein
MSVLSQVSLAAANISLDLKKRFSALIRVATVAAAGSDETDATPLLHSVNVVTGADGAVGVKLPKAEPFAQVEITNTVANQDLLVYPGTGEQINALTATTGAFTQVAGSRATYLCDTKGHWYVAAANLTGTATTASSAELNVLDEATNANDTTGKAAILGTDGAITFAGAAQAASFGSAANTPGVGISGGVGTVFKTSVVKEGDVLVTRILIDLTGLNGGGTAGDIIGTDGAGVAHLGQITAALNGTILGGRMSCLETPVGSNVDVDLWAANESTGVEDTAISALTGEAAGLVVEPGVNQYLYLTSGAATAATFTAGRFLIELFGYDA